MGERGGGRFDQLGKFWTRSEGARQIWTSSINLIFDKKNLAKPHVKRENVAITFAIGCSLVKQFLRDDKILTMEYLNKNILVMKGVGG